MQVQSSSGNPCADAFHGFRRDRHRRATSRARLHDQSGVDGICILANCSEQFLLADEERDTLVDVCLSDVGDRVPVIVTCSHFSTRVAVERARNAASAGAAMLMLMPLYRGAGLRADEKGMLEHFARIADGASLPIMIQDAPLSGVNRSGPFLVRLVREVPA